MAPLGGEGTRLDGGATGPWLHGGARSGVAALVAGERPWPLARDASSRLHGDDGIDESVLLPQQRQ